MVKLRLQRFGSKKRPYYRIVAAEATCPRDGRFIEIVGLYHPIEKQDVLKIDEEKALKWLSVGAIPTDTAKSLMSKLGIIKKFAENKVKAGK